MEAFSFAAPVALTFGAGTVEALGEQVRGLGRRCLVVTDPGVVSAGVAGRVSAILHRSGVEAILFSDVDQNPRAETCLIAEELRKSEGCDVILGLGGGSPMDVAKVVAVMAAHPGMAPRDFEGLEKVKGDPLPLAMVPTTAGTASEVTRFAVITDAEERFKFTVVSQKMLPRLAVLDPALTVSKPPGLTAATGVDALTHAIESFTNRVHNPLADALAARAIQLIGGALRKAVVQGQDLQARSDMLLGSLLAGMAFTATRLGLVHAMSHPVSAHFGVPHGVANAVLLAPVMEYNCFGALEKTAEIARLLEENVSGLSPLDAAQRGVQAVRRLVADVGIPPSLRDLGVTADRIAAMAADTMKSGNVAINPRQVSQSDVLALYSGLTAG